MVYLPLWATVNPDLYEYGFDQWQYDGGTTDIDWYQSLVNGSLGQFWVEKTQWNPPPDQFNPNITVRFSFWNDELYLYNQQDLTVKIPYSLRLATVNVPITTSPYVYQFSLEDDGYVWINIDLKIPRPADTVCLTGNEGIYFSTFMISSYVDYGGPDELLLGEALMVVSVKAGGWEHPTYTYYQLLVDRYPTADNIDVIGMQANQSAQLAVGSVTLISNDDQSYTSGHGHGHGRWSWWWDGDDSTSQVPFELRISPVCPYGVSDQYADKFAFRKPGFSSNPILYKVYVPDRMEPYEREEGEFSIDVIHKGITGFWQDWIELCITALNYADHAMPAGSYSSTIRIELVPKN